MITATVVIVLFVALFVWIYQLQQSIHTLSGNDDALVSEMHSEESPIAESIIETSLLFNQPTDSNDHVLISPDGEWLLSTKVVGSVPFSRYVNYYLELINLKGKANKYIYMDWHIRGEGAGPGLSPLGWSQDGKSIYLVSGGSVPEINASWEQVRSWKKGGGVARLDIDNANSYPNNFINPYGGHYPQGRTGFVLDADPKLDTAIWLDEPIDTTSGTTRLLSFPMQTYWPEENTKELFSLATGTKAFITSASLDSQGTSVAFVLHEDGKQDQLWIKSLETEAKAELIPYDTELLKRAGIEEPYVIMLQKTSRPFEGQGLFLTARDLHGTEVAIRRIVHFDETFWIGGGSTR